MKKIQLYTIVIGFVVILVFSLLIVSKNQLITVLEE